MKISFDAKILDLDGQDIKDGDGALTLAKIACNALLTPDKNDSVSGNEKTKRFKLAMRINGGGEQNLAADEIAMLKNIIGNIFPPLVVGRAFEILDPGID